MIPRFNTTARLLVLFMLVLLPASLSTANPADTTGFIVLTPDRGFLGNDEMRDVFDAFQEEVPEAVLAFATEEEMTKNMETALDELATRVPNLTEVVVLPFVLSKHEQRYRDARAAMEEASSRPLRLAAPFGRSYLAEEILFDRVSALLDAVPDDAQPTPAASHGHHGGHGESSAGHESPAHGPGLVLVAGGAATPEDEAAIRTDLEPMARRAARKFGLADARVTVLYEWAAPEDHVRSAVEQTSAAAREISAHGPALVVPFNLSPRLTTMMADWTRVRGNLRGIDGVVADGAGVVPHENALRWLRRTANSYLPLAPNEIGVILVPHGSDYNWNQAMREALAPITERYVTEEAFSMVDPFVVERAVRRLEERGTKAAVLVRIFSLEENFRAQAEYALGLRDEYHGMHAQRIESHLRFATAGGMEAHPLLAEAMLDRAQEISTDPANETVVLVAHGTGSDDRNAHWMENLGQIAAHIEENSEFRDVEYHTWREDWPDKREASIATIRSMVEEASRGAGTTLVIPVRTIAQGPEAELLEGLDYRHGRGFAPHPKFVEWVESVIQEGIAQLDDTPRTGDTAAR